MAKRTFSRPRLGVWPDPMGESNMLKWALIFAVSP